MCCGDMTELDKNSSPIQLQIKLFRQLANAGPIEIGTWIGLATWGNF